jgi:hypothetical protein
VITNLIYTFFDLIYSNRIAEYESKIQKLESLLQERSAAQPQVGEQPLQPAADSSVSAAQWVANLQRELPSIPRPIVTDFDTFDPQTYSGSARFLITTGSAPTPPISSPGHETSAHNSVVPLALDDIEHIEPSAEFQEDAAFLQSTNLEQYQLEDDSLLPPPLPPGPECDGYLPPPDLGTALLSEFLVDFNTAYPLYRPHVIVNHLRICYAGQTDGSAVSWVSAYVIFGLAHMLRGMSTAATLHDTELAKYYLSRSYNSLNVLLQSPPSMGLVQCLIGIALLVRSIPYGSYVPDGHFLSTSLRVAQGLAYHDEDTAEEASGRDVGQERRVFWLAFIHDITVSMVSNSPSTHRREDIVAPIPEQNPADNLGAVVSAEGHWKVNIFSLRVELALLQAEAIEQVLSIKARNTLPLDLEAATAIVLARLQAFHEHEIFSISPEQLFQLLYRSDIAHTVALEAAYFATVYRLHAFLAFDKNPRINPFAPEGLRRLSTIQEQKSLTAAMRLLSLLPVAPRGDVGLYWMMHQTFAAALVTVLSHHINNPELPSPTRDDMGVFEALIADLETLAQNSENVDITQAKNLCMELWMRLERTMHYTPQK